MLNFNRSHSLSTAQKMGLTSFKLNSNELKKYRQEIKLSVKDAPILKVKRE